MAEQLYGCWCFTLWLDGVEQKSLIGLDNDLDPIDLARLGIVGGIDAGTAGSHYFDAFVSRRETYIGP